MNVAGSRVRALILVSFAVAAGLASALAATQSAQSGVVPVQAGQVTAPAAQTPPPEPPKGTGIIIGQVIDSGTRRGISGATVAISGSTIPVPQFLPTGEMLMPARGSGPGAAGDAPRQVITDSAGRFMFHSLAAGAYTITANATPYLSGSYGAIRPNGSGQMVNLTRSDEKRDGIVIRMWKAATITGTVTDESGEALIGVNVRSFRRTAQGGRIRFLAGSSGTTDDRGVYRMTGLVPGDYFVGILSTQTTVPVATSDAFMQAMYSGAGATSEIYRDMMSSGVSTMLLRGEGGFRVGDFMVSNGSIYGQGGRSPAPLSETRVLTYPSQFYPSAPIITQATPITLTSGEDRTSIDLHLKLVPGLRVSGTVTGPDGAVKNLGLRLLPAGTDDFSSDSGIESASTITDANGVFTFLGVTPGQYTLKSLRIPRGTQTGRGGGGSMVEVVGPNGMIMGMSMGPSTAPPPPPLPTDPVLWATASVLVAETDVNGLNVTVRTGARLAGRIVFDGEMEKPASSLIQQASISLTNVAAGASVSAVPRRVEAEGNFATLGYPPGRYLVSSSIPQSTAGPMWRLKSVTSNGRDVSDVGLEIGSSDITDLVITFTDKSTELTGSATSDGGQPDVTASVVVLPADSAAWREGVINTRRIRSTRVSTTGSYRFADLPPGAYFIAAISNDLLDDWQLPSKLEAIARVAVRVTLAEGAKVTQALTTKVIR